MKKLIIGATGSIGSSLAKKIIAEGGEVHLVGRDESSLSNLASELKSTFTTCDVLEENFSDKIFDVHLMINRVKNFLDEYINAGSDVITFHCEVNEDIKEIITKIKKGGIKSGLAIKPKTPWTEIKPYLNFVDQIIIMTVEPGFGGQEFMNDQIDKIKNISDYVKTNDLNVSIEIDGGINYETGKICVDAGANILVAGSFLFNQGDLITATNKLSDNFN